MHHLWYVCPVGKKGEVYYDVSLPGCNLLLLRMLTDFFFLFIMQFMYTFEICRLISWLISFQKGRYSMKSRHVSG